MHADRTAGKNGEKTGGGGGFVGTANCLVSSAPQSDPVKSMKQTACIY